MKNWERVRVGKLLLWLLTCGAVAAFGQTAELVVETGHITDVSSVAFSPDGKVLASSSITENTRLWDVATGQELRTLVGTKPVFSPDGKTLASTEVGIKLWNWQTGQALKTIPVQPSVLSSVAFSSNGEVLAIISSEPDVIILWDVASGQQIRTLAGFTDSINSVAFSPGGKILASSSGDSIKLWNWQTGQQLREIPVEAGPSAPLSRSFAFSPNGETLASLSDLGQAIRLWNVATGVELKIIKPKSPGVYNPFKHIAFSPDGKTLVTNIFGVKEDRKSADTITLWDVETGSERLTIDAKGGVWSIVFSPDGKTLAGGVNNQPKIWSADTGAELRTLAGHVTQVTTIGVSADGSILASGDSNGAIRLWNLQQGQVQTLQGHTAAIKTVAFSPDGKTLASGDAQKTIKLWNIATGQVLKSLLVKAPDTQQQVEAVVPAFYRHHGYELTSADGRLKISQWENGVNIYEADNVNKPLASLILLDEKEWVVVTPNGLFDASRDARKLMHYVVGLETIALEQMKDVYYVPGLLPHIMKGERLPRVGLFARQDLFPSVAYAPLQPKQKQLNVQLTNRGGGIGQVQVLVNGKELVADARPPGFNPDSASATITIDLSKATVKAGEENKIEVVARNAAGSLSTRGTRGAEIVYFDDGQKQVATPNIYAIVGGISDYTGEQLKLSFAAKDAEDFARVLELGAIKLLYHDRSKVHIRLLTSNGAQSSVKFSSPDAKISTATKSDFEQAFADFRHATPNDVFIVYLAGHGVSLNLNQNPTQAGGDTYLYLTQEATTTDKSLLAVENSRLAMALSSNELAELMKQNKALKQVLVLDTCAAGAATASLITKRDLPDNQIRAIERLKDRTGFFALMGAAADRVSYEAGQYGQGLLTYTLLQAMKGAKLRDNEFADVSLLFGYAQDTVPEMAKNIGGIQRPLIIAPDASGSFDIGRYTAAEQKLIALSAPKPLVLRPSMQNKDLGYDDLDLEGLLRQELRDASYFSGRGGSKAALVFVEADEMVDAIKLSGSYTVEGDNLRVTINLIYNKVPFKTLPLAGKVSDRRQLVKQIVAAVSQIATPIRVNAAALKGPSPYKCNDGVSAEAKLNCRR